MKKKDEEFKMAKRRTSLKTRFMNMSLKAKFLTFLVLTVITLIVTSIYSVTSAQKAQKELEYSLHTVAYTAVKSTIAADRDIYQAHEALLQMTNVDGSDKKFEDLQKTLTDNINQTNDRLDIALKTFELDKENVSKVKHKTTGNTVFDIFPAYEETFKKWGDEAVQYAEVIKKTPMTEREGMLNQIYEYDQDFNSARNYIDELNQTGDAYTTSIIENLASKNKSLIFTIMVIDVIAVLLVMTLGSVFLQSILNVLKKIIKRTGDIATGDLKAKETILASECELGTLSKTIETMERNLKNIIVKVMETSQHVAISSQQLTTSAEQTTRASEQIAFTVQNIAKGYEDQVSNIDKSSQVIIDMSNNIDSISTKAFDVSNNAVTASSSATSGSNIINTAITQMNSIQLTVKDLDAVISSLHQRSTAIEEILGVITSIADQTNLLALNAAIEAARAGDAGKGFAVVADEVRKLAEKSRQSALQISDLILSIQGETSKAMHSMTSANTEVSQGIQVVNNAGKSFKEIETAVNDVAHQISDVSTAIKEVANGTKVVSESIKQILSVATLTSTETQQASSISEEQSASMQEIVSSAESLNSVAVELKSVVTHFKV